MLNGYGRYGQVWNIPSELLEAGDLSGYSSGCTGCGVTGLGAQGMGRRHQKRRRAQIERLRGKIRQCRAGKTRLKARISRLKARCTVSKVQATLPGEVEPEFEIEPDLNATLEIESAPGFGLGATRNLADKVGRLRGKLNKCRAGKARLKARIARIKSRCPKAAGFGEDWEDVDETIKELYLDGFDGLGMGLGNLPKWVLPAAAVAAFLWWKSK